MDISLFYFWAKTDRSGLHDGSVQFHPLIYHLLDVAACADALLHQERSRVEQLAKSCNVDPDDLSRCFTALVALHDIGKCARGFQGKVPDLWPDFLGTKPNTPLSVRHDVAGVWLFDRDDKLAAIIECLFPNLSASSRLKIVQAVCGHHGEPIDAHDDYPRNTKRDIGPKSQEAALTIAEAMVDLLQPPACPLQDRHVPVVSYWFAGLSVLADWLGSNRTWFEFRPPPTSGDLRTNMSAYWHETAQPGAERALRESGLLPAAASPRKRFAELFDASYHPTPLQDYADTVALPEGPVLFIVEDMTGAGKTEAAVLLAHRLMLAGKGRGLYVALPTMATANAMFGRLAGNYRRLFGGAHAPSIVLTHGRRNLFAEFTHLTGAVATYDGDADDEDDPSKIEASAFCADWIARSNKQAFLAQVGAGTIDQALLAVLPARHQSLRLWGLADKILVIDEAHAYDAYMSKEIERLLHFHAAFGGSAIILSATLPKAKRGALAHAFIEGAQEGGKSSWLPAQDAYPLATLIAAGTESETPLALRDSLQREVVVQRIASLDDAHARALDAARHGGAVALIRNTVDEAIASHQALAPQFDDVLLFHARFAMGDRQARETEVLGRFGKDTKGRRNAILVATQVIEQSLDLDFDLVITDLAPVDLLIQRAGRLWRHDRGVRPIAGLTLLVLSPEPTEEAGEGWPAPMLPKTGFVYRNASLLWRSAKAIFSAGRIVSRTSEALASPESGELRALVEAVYGEAALTIPPGLEIAENKALGKDSGDRTLAGYKLLELEAGYDWAGTKWERETKVETRLGEDTITLRLARLEGERIVPWIAVENNDYRRAWALSEVSVRRALCSGDANPSELQARIEAAKRDWSLSEKDIPVVVLAMGDECEWHGRVLDKKQVSIGIVYSTSTGLRLPAE
jgi:CRISPR-associated endonuclease/helicase Cas3